VGGKKLVGNGGHGEAKRIGFGDVRICP
jgi:hypothetical protein